MTPGMFHQDDLGRFSFLVTGGAGFIGSHLVEYLLTHKAGKVIVLDNLSTGFISNIRLFESFPQFHFIEGDITDPETCSKACQGIDYVFHQAALGSVPRSIKDPLATNQANITGFLNMLNAAREQKVRRIVYASSSSVFGDSAALPKVEEQLGNPLSPYAVTKRVNELYGQVFSRIYKMEIIGLRYFNIFGPRQNPGGPYAAAIPLFMQALMDHKRPVIFGDGEQSRDFTYVENAVQANIRAMFCPAETATGEVFNIAVGERITVNQLYHYLRETAGSDLQPEYAEERPGDVKHSLADISKAVSLLGYQPAVQVREGLSRTFQWFRQQAKV